MVHRPAHNVAPCAKRVGRNPLDRDHPVVDQPDLGDVGFHDGFALARGAAAEDVGKVLVDVLDRRGVGRLDFVELARLCLPGGELVELGRELVDAAAANWCSRWGKAPGP